MLYEVITYSRNMTAMPGIVLTLGVLLHHVGSAGIVFDEIVHTVITSYSIHYTKLYDVSV